MRHRWQVQAGFELQGAPGRAVEPLGVTGCLWSLVAEDSLALGVRVKARTAPEALTIVERRLRAVSPPGTVPVRLGAEVRRAPWAGLGRRRAVRFSGVSGGSAGGTAGVREPRRPLPPGPALSAAVPLPRDPAKA